MYEITYTGMDGYDRTEEFEALEDAVKAYTWIEEHGGHCLTLYDEDGEEMLIETAVKLVRGTK